MRKRIMKCGKTLIGKRMNIRKDGAIMKQIKKGNDI